MYPRRPLPNRTGARHPDGPWAPGEFKTHWQSTIRVVRGQPSRPTPKHCTGDGGVMVMTHHWGDGDGPSPEPHP